MKLMSFPEILDCENGQQITALQGTVKKVFEQKSDIGQYGPWHLQNIVLQDEHANELTVTWTCEDAFDAGVEGQTLYIESGRDKKDQLAGIKREIKKKNGKTYESIKVDDRAKVKILNGKTAKTANIPKSRDGDPNEYGDGSPDPDWPEAPATDSGPFVERLPIISKDDYWRRKEQRDVEVQRFIIRQHSQSMALEVLKLKVTLNELTVEDLTPAKLRQLADYFDNDVIEAAQ